MNVEKAIKILRDTGVGTKLDYRYSAETLNAVKKTAIQALQAQAERRWIPVSERLPENEERVLICAEKKMFDGTVKQIITTAMHEDGTMRESDSGFGWENVDFDYVEETDDFLIPEGWYEQNMYCEYFGVVDDFVTHWMPLPEPPKE